MFCTKYRLLFCSIVSNQIKSLDIFFYSFLSVFPCEWCAMTYAAFTYDIIHCIELTFAHMYTTGHCPCQPDSHLPGICFHNIIVIKMQFCSKWTLWPALFTMSSIRHYADLVLGSWKDSGDLNIGLHTSSSSSSYKKSKSSSAYVKAIDVSKGSNFCSSHWAASPDSVSLYFLSNLCNLHCLNVLLWGVIRRRVGVENRWVQNVEYLNVEMERKRVYPRRSGHNSYLCLFWHHGAQFWTKFGRNVLSYASFYTFPRKFLELVCKHDWYNIRSYLFLNVLQKKEETNCANAYFYITLYTYTLR